MNYKEITFPKETKFLVTGAAGFIGSNLVETLLSLGCSVRGLDNYSTGYRDNLNNFIEHPNFEILEGDIRNFDTCSKACEGITFVLHQAAWGSVPRSILYPLLYEEINVKGTLHMMEAARKNGVQKFIYASSSSVYGDEPHLPKKEGREGSPLSPYAVTKKVNEVYGELYTKVHGLETYGLRYFNVFGKHQDPNGEYAAVIPKFISQLLRKERPRINGNGMQSRDFTYIDNVIEANLKACKASKKAAGQVYNIAYGEQEYLIDVYREICRQLEIEMEPLYGPVRVGDIAHSNADISKAREWLGYCPEYDFIRGLELAISWYKEFLGLSKVEFIQ